MNKTTGKATAKAVKTKTTSAAKAAKVVKTAKAAKAVKARTQVAPRTAKAAATNGKKPATGQVLSELKSLAKELSKAAEGLNKTATSNNPKQIAAILGSVERMISDAANKSLLEVEKAKVVVNETLVCLGNDWNRKQIETGLHVISDHLTNIIVAQEFGDLGGQAIRKAIKALVGALVVDTGPDLSQAEADAMIKQLMP